MQFYEAAVRRMLRHARKPATLAKLQLVSDLCAAIGVTSPTAMLRSLVDATFAPFPHDRLMHELLVQCDLEGRFKQSGFARHAGFSRRRFDAARLEAIRRVAAYARTLIDDTGGRRNDIVTTLADALLAVNPEAANSVYEIAQRRGGSAASVAALRARADSGESLRGGDARGLRGPDHARGLAIVAQSMALGGAGSNDIEEVVAQALSVLESSAPNDAQTLFELEWLNFVVSRSENRAAAMAAASANLRRIAGAQPALKRRASLASAWAAVRCGATSRAREMLDDLCRAAARPLDAHEAGLAHLVEAELDFLEERDASAQEHAWSAYRELSSRAPDGSWAATLLARVDIEREAGLKHILEVRQRGSWEHTAALAALSRLLLRGGDVSEAGRLAEQGRATAYRRYPGLLAHCLVTKGSLKILEATATWRKRSIVRRWQRLQRSTIASAPSISSTFLAPRNVSSALCRHLLRSSRRSTTAYAIYPSTPTLSTMRFARLAACANALRRSVTGMRERSSRPIARHLTTRSHLALRPCCRDPNAARSSAR